MVCVYYYSISRVPWPLFYACSSADTTVPLLLLLLLLLLMRNACCVALCRCITVVLRHNLLYVRRSMKCKYLYICACMLVLSVSSVLFTIYKIVLNANMLRQVIAYRSTTTTVSSVVTTAAATATAATIVYYCCWYMYMLPLCSMYARRQTCASVRIRSISALMLWAMRVVKLAVNHSRA
jgi:hypothetical protein